MVRKFRLQNLDCANCAAKMERKINKIKGVNSATVNFMTLRLDMDIVDGMENEVIVEAEKAMKSVESDIKMIRAN